MTASVQPPDTLSPLRSAPRPRRNWMPGYHPTQPGIIYAGVTTFALLAAINSGTNLLYFVSGLMIGAFVVSLALSAISLRKIHIHRIFGEHAVTGEAADILYEITNRKRFWPCMAIRFEEIHPDLLSAPAGFVLHIPQKGVVNVPTRLVPSHRGILRLTHIRFSCAFPFGFLRRVVVRSFAQEMAVYPRIGMLNRHLALQYRESIETGTMTSNVRGGSDEFYGVREYRPGDNIRAIHWRSSARTGQLMIRELSANAPPQMIVVLNLRTARGSMDHDAVEQAIELAATLICYGFFENFAVGLAIAGLDVDEPPSPQMGRDARARMLRRLATLDPGNVRKDAGIVFPNRLVGRAESIIITLHGSDNCFDLLGSAAARDSAAGRRGAHPTLLAVDAADAATWVHFLTGQDTLRLLRERTSDSVPAR